MVQVINHKLVMVIMEVVQVIFGRVKICSKCKHKGHHIQVILDQLDPHKRHHIHQAFLCMDHELDKVNSVILVLCKNNKGITIHLFHLHKDLLLELHLCPVTFPMAHQCLTQHQLHRDHILVVLHLKHHHLD